MRLSVSSLISNYMDKALDLTHDDRERISYSLQIIIGESSKLIIMFLAFFLLNRHEDFLKSVLALSIIRLYTGGLHFRTYRNCLIFSFLFFLTSIFLSDYFLLPRPSLLIVGLVGLLLIALISPITSKNRPVYSNMKRFKFKIIGCAVVVLHLIGFMATKNNPYFRIAIWVIFLQAVQLIIAKGVEYHEKKIPA